MEHANGVDDEEADVELGLSYLVGSNELKDHSHRILKGDKPGTQWLVIKDQYIYHRNDNSLDGSLVYWECSRRRRVRYIIFL